MDTLQAIATRRSIRSFKSDPIPDELLEKLLITATQAPSGKNLQPWRFVVVRGEKRREMVRVMREGIAKFEARGEPTGSSVYSANVMEQAPVTVFVFNAEGKHPSLPRTISEALWDVVNVQSIGAAIENMCLAAKVLGLGSLWICDVFFAYDELCAWLGQDGEMIAAVSLGYPDVDPPARSRKPLAEVVTWL